MRKPLLLLALVALCCLSASAQRLDFLTLSTTDGVERSFTAVGAKITFADGQMFLQRKAVTEAALPLSELAALQFSAEATAIDAAPAAAEYSVRIVAGRLVTDAPAGTPIAVRNAAGQRVESDRLPAGLYLVTIAGVTHKLLAR